MIWIQSRPVGELHISAAVDGGSGGRCRRQKRYQLAVWWSPLGAAFVGAAVNVACGGRFGEPGYDPILIGGCAEGRQHWRWAVGFGGRAAVISTVSGRKNGAPHGAKSCCDGRSNM
ncbi:hypothetical protein FGB62_383g01 [Gracilaria domingensis]|nr:hypothetical protein FGB62_383g01 [Gracilaria domingensis]